MIRPQLNIIEVILTDDLPYKETTEAPRVMISMMPQAGFGLASGMLAGFFARPLSAAAVSTRSTADGLVSLCPDAPVAIAPVRSR